MIGFSLLPRLDRVIVKRKRLIVCGPGALDIARRQHILLNIADPKEQIASAGASCVRIKATTQRSERLAPFPAGGVGLPQRIPGIAIVRRHLTVAEERIELPV